ncbi:peptide-methionine (S)-S-oxide reductase MsrA [Cyclobacterium plantarum]|uniref:Peptide methionine sulfoxide reductase MsrA n=1 Tax=Cyclobacterium plantarum TaxID=2716263 RepID=A0ABX0H9D1_9BACT|nr:peptide-methionine (S)-S-oxide reductase MsrA [Cyclobacterium plantarum]NHE57473.1 peptide-methionine (S)-S-oxide reductase MsrA [Cyclobacterium plantarum]
MQELPKTTIKIPEKKAVATFGTGCFWCTEAVFQKLKGVDVVQSGFSGGHIENPSYKDVVTGTTGHAEVVHLIFDPGQIGFSDLLEVFWSSHDPTTLNRQGADVGPQYRSAIFYHSPEQEQEATQMKAAMEKEKVFDGRIVTEITPFSNFYPAEDYHTNYFELNGSQPYCQFVIRPKVEKFKKKFSEKLK